MRIDLHCHSTFSDGSYTPLELLEMAEKQKIELFAITDHDTIAGTIIAMQHAEKYSFKYIVGVEISANLKGKKYEILGYNFDISSTTIAEALNYLQESRKARLFTIIEQLKKVDIYLDYSDIMEQVEEGGSPGRPHVAKALITKGFAKDVDEAFANYLNPGRSGYVQKKAYTPKQAIEIIKRAKGTPIFPHPLQFEYKDSKRLEELLNMFLEWGIEGIETFYDYSCYDPPLPENLVRKRIKEIRMFCRKYDLLETVGSDFHGYKGQLGNVKIPEDAAKKIIDYFC